MNNYDEEQFDARVRAAYQQQFDDVRRRVGDREFTPDVTSIEPRTSNRILAVAAAVLVLVMGVAVASQIVGPPEGEPLETSAAAESSDTQDPVQDDQDVDAPTPDPSTSLPAASITTSTVAQDDSAGTDEESTTTTTTDSASEPTPAPTGTSTIPEDSVPAPEPPEVSLGLPNAVCPSGARAELERAALKYVSDLRGWGRMEDLVDEQDGPDYFEGWEPGFGETVAVQLILDQPVRATEFRVAQDPSNPVSGTIFLEAAQQTFEIELSGSGGWKVHELDAPLFIETVTIERRAEESNIMEFVVCVSSQP